MRNVFSILVFLTLISCKNETVKTNIEQHDKIKNTHVKTSKTLQDSIPIEEDDFFMAFFEKFITDTTFQKSRVNFPFEYYGEKYAEKDWENITSFYSKEFFSYILPENIGFETDQTSLEQISVDVIEFPDQDVRTYQFEKIKGLWKLKSVYGQNLQDLKENDFMQFLIEFSRSADYQKNHIIFPIKETLLDLQNNEVKEIQSEVKLEEWEFFNLNEELGMLIIVNAQNVDKKNKSIYLRGNKNGIAVTYQFEKINGEWRFVEIVDHST